MPLHTHYNGYYLKKKKCWSGYGEIGTFVFCQQECNMIQPLWKIVWQFLRKLNIELLYDPAIPLLGIYPKEPKTETQTDICTPWSLHHYSQ